MLKRSGELCRYCVPGFAGRLTESEHNLYLEALSAVKKQLLELSDFSHQLNQVAELCESASGITVSRNGADSVLTTPKPPASWKVVNQILKLELGSILLCSREDGDGLDYAIVQRFLPQSLYAKAHGATVVQAQGNDPTILVQDYIERVRHTLRFMASDAVARAQEIIWKNSNDRDVSRVVRAISDQFNEAVAEKIETGQNSRMSILTENQHNGVRFSRRM
jgi:hypothetical protein